MHELSLAGEILQMVEQARARDPFERVTQLGLEVGTLSGVETSALRFALEAISVDTCLAGAVIDISEPLAKAHCLACGEVAEISSRLDACPACEASQWRTSGGAELRVTALLVV